MGIKYSKLTRTNMRQLLKDEVIIEHGIMFSRLASGDGVFRVCAMIDGIRVNRTVGYESDGTTRSQAEDQLGKFRQDAKHDRLSLPRGRKLALGFEEAAGSYMERLKQEGGKDMAAKKRRLNQHLIPFFGKTPLAKITTFDLNRFKKHRKDAGAKEGTVNRELAVVSHLFSKGVDWGWLKCRPAKIERLKEDNGKIVYLTISQLHRLVEEARADQDPRMYPFIMIAAGTAMRKMEVLSIRKEHIDLSRRTIFVPEAKAGMREQPITKQLVTFLLWYLETLPSDTPWLFPSPSSNSGHRVEIRDSYRRVVRAAGMDPDEIVRHTLRHTAITHLVQAGVDLPTVKRISGHKTLIMVERYAHQNGQHIQTAMDVLDDRYGELA